MFIIDQWGKNGINYKPKQCEINPSESDENLYELYIENVKFSEGTKNEMIKLLECLLEFTSRYRRCTDTFDMNVEIQNIRKKKSPSEYNYGTTTC